MGYMYDDRDGEFAVKTARKVVEFFLEHKSTPYLEFPEKFKKKGGVFTTISTYPDHNLRGCIGYPEPILELEKALVQSAIAAAFEDPRFPPLQKDEIDHVVFEVSLLTPPEEIKVKRRKDLLKEVEVGKHGLIAEHGFYRGLLLPQVPIEWKWNVQEFLEETCVKAGLPMDCWLDEYTKFYRFTAEIFEEEEPRGKVRRKRL